MLIKFLQIMWYRNNKPVISTQGVQIDETSLWRLDPEQNLLVLEDDDQYQTHPLDLEVFEEAQ